MKRLNRWMHSTPDRNGNARAVLAVLMAAGLSLTAAGCGGDEAADDDGDDDVDLSVGACASTAAAGDLCDSAEAQTLSQADIEGYDEAASFDAVTGVTAIGDGVVDYRISYQTEYDNYHSGSRKATATGRVLMPAGGASNAPLLIWGHGTTGTADKCAPSSTVAGIDKHAYQYAARGFVVFAPDYAGLGVEDEMHYYLVKEPTALSIWDGAYAAKEFVESNGGTLSGSTVLLGHSQGGQAVLFAQQYYEDNGSNSHLDSVKDDFDVVQVVSAAPAPQWVKALAIANADFAAANGVDDPTLAFMLAVSYIHAASDYYGLAEGDLLLDASITAVEGWFDTQCQTELGGLVAAGESPISNVATEVFETAISTGAAASAAGSACMGSYGLGTGAYCPNPSDPMGDVADDAAQALTYASTWYTAAVSALNAGDDWGTRMNLDGTGTALSGPLPTYISTAGLLIVHGDADTLVPSGLSSLLYGEMAGAYAAYAGGGGPGGVLPVLSILEGADHTGSITAYDEYVDDIFGAVAE